MAVKLCYFISIVIVFTLGMMGPTHAADDDQNLGIYKQSGRNSDRLEISDESGAEYIDPLAGGLSLQYLDGVIAGQGGFNLPLYRRYKSFQVVPAGANVEPQRPDTILGTGWDMHFGRIKSEVIGSSLTFGLGPLKYCYPVSNGYVFENTKENPVFEDMNGESHLLVGVNDSTSDIGDMTSSANHRVKCNQDGSIEITDANGIKYTFGLQKYLKNGSGVNDYADIDTPSLVVFSNSVYVTKISDAHGNSFEFKYTKSDNSDGRQNRTVFALEHISQGSSQVAKFTYNDLNDTYYSEAALVNSPELVLKQIGFQQKTIKYRYERVNTDLPIQPIRLRKAFISGANGFDWEYRYYDYVGSYRSPNTVNLKQVKNRYGGTTEYTYQQIHRFNGSLPNRLTAIHTKKMSSYGGKEWRYEFDDGLSNSGFDTTTISYPDNRIEEQVFCNVTSRDPVCKGLEGVLVEKRVLNNTGRILQTELFDWRLDRNITNQRRYIPIYRGIGQAPAFITQNYRTKVLAQTVVQRDNSFYSTAYFSFDKFGFPGTVIEKKYVSRPVYTGVPSTNQDSAPNTVTGRDNSSRRRELTYTHLTNHWLIGLLKSEKLNELRSIPTTGTTSFTYDPKGNKKTETQYGVSRTFDYDRRGNLTKITQPNGNVVSFSNHIFGIAQQEAKSFVLRGAPVIYKTRVVNSRTGLVSSVTDGENNTTNYTYDRAGQLESVSTARTDDENIQITRQDRKIVTIRGGRTTEEHLDTHGRMIKSVTSDGGIFIAVDMQYDVFGRRVFASLPHSQSVISDYGKYKKYDELGRIKEERIGGQFLNSGDDMTTRYVYRPDRVAITDRMGQTTTMYYQSYGSPTDRTLVKMTQPEGVITTLSRTKRGDILSIDQNGVQRKNTYNGRYLIEKTTEPESGESIFTYDINSNLRTSQVGNSGITTFTYNGRDNISSIIYPTSSSTSAPTSPNVFYAYYKDDLVRRVSKGRTRWSYTYDQNRNLKTESLVYATADQIYTIRHNFNALDYVDSTDYPNGERVTFNPDVFGRSHTAGQYVSDATYYPNGQLKDVTYGNGLRKSIAVNSRQIPERIELKSSNAILGFEEYRYDKNVNLESLRTSINGTSVFSYDGLNRLSNLRRGNNNYEYKYDENGNIRSYQAPELGSSIQLNYDQNRQLLKTVSGITNMATRSFSYDVYANVSGDGIATYNFDDSSQLREYRRGSVTVFMEYDGFGKRTATTQNGLSTLFLYDRSGRLLYETTPHNGDYANYVYLGSEMVARVDAFQSVIGPTGGDDAETETGDDTESGTDSVSGKPSAPADVLAIATGNTVTLTWNGVADAEKYNVYDESGYRTTRNGRDNTSFTDTNVSAGIHLYYVIAIDEARSGDDQFSLKSNESSVVVSDNSNNDDSQNNGTQDGNSDEGENANLRPSPPINVRASVSGSTVSVNWSVVAEADKYNVSDESGYRTTIIGKNNTEFIDDSVSDGQHSYRVVSIDESRTGDNRYSVKSNAATVTVGSSSNSDQSANSPADFRAQAYSGTSAELFWTASVDNNHGGQATSYEIYRDGIRIETTTNSSSFYMSSGLIEDRVHKFEIIAVYPNGNRSAKAGPINLRLAGGQTSY